MWIAGWRPDGARAAAFGVALLVAGCSGSGGGASAGSAAAPASHAPQSSATPARPSTASTAAATSSPAVSRIPLDGQGPIGLAVVDGIAWVAASESGDVIEVTLATGANRVYNVGAGATHVLAPSPEEVLVARFEGGGQGEGLVIVAPRSGAIRGVATGALAGFDLADDGRLWALGTKGEIAVVDKARKSVVGRTSIDVHPNEHLDAVAGAGAFWASSDTTPVRRLSGRAPSVKATIETGGGIPLAYANGIVWGARADELWGIDPATNSVTKHVALDGLIEILDLDVAGDRAWIAARKPGRIGTVVGIDLDSGLRIAEADVSLPAGVVVSGRTIWVTSNETDELIGFESPPT